jgi:hypothetical protein
LSIFGLFLSAITRFIHFLFVPSPAFLQSSFP